MIDDLNDFIESGIIEKYCLGDSTQQEEALLIEYCNRYPEIQSLLERSEQAMELYIRSFQKIAPSSGQSKIMEILRQNEQLKKLKLSGEEQLLEEFITLSRHLDIKKLEALVKELKPPAEFENIHMKPLFSDGNRKLNLIWVKNRVPEETHPELEESFYVLEGEVDCHVDGKVFRLKRGDFMQMPIHSNHEIIVTSSNPVKAILSWIERA